jgi:RNA polymerase sigma-70 factor (ECF subfamily)
VTDELRRVQGFCTSEPPPSDAARRAARGALSRAMAEETTGLHPAIRPRRPRLRMLAIATAAVAAAAVVAGVFSSGGSPVGPSPATAAVFHRLARLIAAQPLTPGPGQYLYVESRSEYPAFEGSSSCETLSLDHRQIWIGRDGSGLLRETRGPERFSSATDQAACLQVDPGMKLRAGGTSNDWFAPDCLALGPTNDWSSLSSDPQTLLQQMRKLDGGPPTAGEDFVHVGDFLRETDAPPAVRATIYQAAALIPGVELLGTVRDHAGRPGLGVAYSSNGNTSELIFDPRTGELLGEQDTGPTGELQDWAVYLDERVANGLPSAPPAPLTPPCVNYGGYVHSTPGGDVTTGAPVN